MVSNNIEQKFLFSIVIPTYNRANFILKTIKSILSQTYINFEVIVVDDGSTDNTEEIVRSIRDNRIRYYKKKNEERGAARNFGCRMAFGKYVNFFDSDDLAYTNHLQTALDTIDVLGWPEVFHLNYEIKDINAKIVRTPSKIKDVNMQLLNGNLLSCNGVFIRKDIALHHPFSEIRELSASEDYFLWLQLAANYKIHHNKVITSTIIQHDKRSVIVSNKENLIVRKTLLLELLFDHKDCIKKYSRYKNIIYGNTNLYIALHLALINYRMLSIYYLRLSIRKDPLLIFDKRTFATIKHLIYNDN